MFLLIIIFAISITQNSLIGKAEKDSTCSHHKSELPNDSDSSNQYRKYAAIAGVSILTTMAFSVIGTALFYEIKELEKSKKHSDEIFANLMETHKSNETQINLLKKLEKEIEQQEEKIKEMEKVLNL